MALTLKQAKFVASYQIIHNSTQAAINAGYPAKSAASVGCQLLKNPKISTELDAWKAKKAAEITKEDFIDLAMKDYKQLDVTQPNKPRNLEIIGKTLGHLGNNNESRPNQTINVMNVSFTGTESQKELWEKTRKLLSND